MPKGTRPCRDHKGNEYPSVTAMLAAYGIPRSTYGNRLKRGWTKEQALETPTDGNAPKVNHKKPVQDHEGTWWNCVREMTEHWGINEKVYWSRKRLLKWSLEKILTTPVMEYEAANAISVTDHLGQPFPSISEMCRAWHVGLSTYRERRKRGWDVERSLTGKAEAVNDMTPQECTDHLGQAYPSLNAMCRAYGITRYCYQSRLDLGWTKEQALTAPIVIHSNAMTDYMGREFPSAADMANFHGVPRYAFQGKGVQKKPFHEIIKGWWEDRDCGRYHVKRMVEFPYFLARAGSIDIIVHYEKLLDEWHDTDMHPIVQTATSEKRIHVLKRVEFPWYLVELDGITCIKNYWDLIRFHADTNFGLQPKREKQKRKVTENGKERNEQASK